MATIFRMARAYHAPMSKSARRIIWIVIVIAVAAVVWRKVIRDQVIPENFGVVEEGAIYRSAQLTERMLDAVCEEREIRTILNLTGESVDYERDVAAAHGANLIEVTMQGDGTGEPSEMARALDVLSDPANHPILVHCAAGAQRTGSIVLLYRHLEQGIPVLEAYPESFDYEHKADEWILLAHLVEVIDEIKRIREGAASESAGATGTDASDDTTTPTDES